MGWGRSGPQFLGSWCWPHPELPCRLEIQMASVPLPFFFLKMFLILSVCHTSILFRTEDRSSHCT